MSGTIGRVRAWAEAADWRTWIGHSLLAGLFTVFGWLLGQAMLFGVFAVAYYVGKEDLASGGPYTRDRVLDALCPAVTVLAILAVKWGIA